ncbi:MAG: PAS domain-containing protein [Desulfovibrio sp.]|nr:PAS domain-containing protein [Desulfovibrio sp.]MBI4959154.1 PAS domain-containing protein [Desulfovibrio sp.]
MSLGLDKAFEKSGLKIEKVVEYLEAARYRDSPDYPEFLKIKRDSVAALLKKMPADAVILNGLRALNFWLKHRQTLAPNIPVVFAGINTFSPEMLQGQDGITGVFEGPAFQDTLQLALRLLPATKKILVLSGPTTNNVLNVAEMERSTGELKGAIEPVYFQEREISAMEGRLRELGPEWVVFAMVTPRNDGVLMQIDEAARRIVAASKVPVFTGWSYWVKEGVLGGKVVSMEAQGDTAGRMMAGILRNGPGSPLPPVVDNSEQNLFDYNAVQRFGLNPDEFPEDRIFLNKPVSFYGMHKQLVWGYGLVTLLLVTISIILAYNLVVRRRLQRQLGAQVNFVQSLMEAMPTPIFYKDASGIYQGCNPAFSELMGVKRELLLGRSVLDLYPPDEAQVYKNKDDELFSSREGVQVYEYEKESPRGPRQVRFHKALYRDGEGGVAGLVGVIADITDLRKAEGDLEKTRAYLQAILDSSPSIILCMDETGKVTHANMVARQACGECSLPVLESSLPQADHILENVRRSISEGIVLVLPRQVYVKDGATNAQDVVIYPLHTIGLREAVVRIDEATEQHRMQELLVQSEKMMSVGGLAAGMAHEINNPLGGIMQSAQVILSRMRPDAPANQQAAIKAGCSLEDVLAYLNERQIPELLAGIRGSAKRAAGIVSNMLEFSKRSSSAWLPVDVNMLVGKALDLCLQDYSLPSNYDFKKTKIVREFDQENPCVPCSPQQIQQVVFNLLRNAAQAMAIAGTPAPSITVRTRRDAQAVIIEVEDTGPGMDDATRRKVFEPFFTTKEPGHGTGLGLSVSYFIVCENHGGELTVESQPGAGAKFTIRLPLKDKSCLV